MDFPTLSSPSLPLVAILIGIILSGSHLFGLLAPNPCMMIARAFPRSHFWGTVLVFSATLWTFLITATTDLGEFSSLRNPIMVAVVAGGFLLWKFVPDFLSSRSLGFLLLLAAHPVLETTFLQSGLLKLALAILAYSWALIGLFLVGMPYLHRDLIGWVSEKRGRWAISCWTGLLYGLLLLIDGLWMEFLS